MSSPRPENAADVIVVGGGVIGMMTARELAVAGRRVALLERGHTGSEASWAGGGIVSPLYPWRYPEAVTALATPAQEAYPRLAASLLAETGIDPELFPCGMLMLDAADAFDARTWAAAQGRRLEAWGAVRLQQEMPGLATHWTSGLWMPTVANIRNPRLLQALRASLLALGVVIHEQAEVVAWRQGAGTVSAALTSDGRAFDAADFVVCGGAWTGKLLQQAGQEVALRPVRGQMLLYRLEPGELSCIVLAEGRYVIPRRDGHVLCGSTLEETGFDKSTTAEALASLAASAARLWPALQGREPVAQWAGLRPAAPNGIPYIGRVPGSGNLWVNAGQFRNGLVLAPASARLLADLLLARTPAVDPHPYQILQQDLTAR
ncbi:MAG: D-amino acid oxidase [Moraxellaceae bacterium]|jgi:glycine oxidase|nr:D-amino acid oxidase [Moraxellaceae bacterium]